MPARFFLDGCKTELQPVKIGFPYFFLRGIFLRCVFAVINVRYDFFLDGCKTELQPVYYRFFGLFFDADGCDMCEKLMWLCISCLCLCCPPMVMVINLSTNPYRYARQASFSLLISLLSASYYYRMSTNMNFMNFVLLLYYFIYIFLWTFVLLYYYFMVFGYWFWFRCYKTTIF